MQNLFKVSLCFFFLSPGLAVAQSEALKEVSSNFGFTVSPRLKETAQSISESSAKTQSDQKVHWVSHRGFPQPISDVDPTIGGSATKLRPDVLDRLMHCWEFLLLYPRDHNAFELAGIVSYDRSEQEKWASRITGETMIYGRFENGHELWEPFATHSDTRIGRVGHLLASFLLDSRNPKHIKPGDKVIHAHLLKYSLTQTGLVAEPATYVDDYFVISDGGQLSYDFFDLYDFINAVTARIDLSEMLDPFTINFISQKAFYEPFVVNVKFK